MASTTLRDVMRYIVSDMTTQEAETIYKMLDLMVFAQSKAVPEPEDSPLQKLGAASYAYRKARAAMGLGVAQLVAKRAPRASKATKAKRIRRRPYGKFHPHGKNQSKVWEALTQSTGWLSSDDLAPILDIPMMRVSSALSALYQGRHGRKLERRVRERKDGGPRTYEYQYVNGD